MSLRSILGNVRVRARDPRAQQPSDRTLLVLLSTQVQNLLLEANLRGRYWSVDETQVAVNPNTTDYAISAENFGKPTEVRAVYSTGGYPEHDVTFFELGDLNYDLPWSGGQLVGDPLYGGPPLLHQRVAFYRRANQVYLRTLPGVPGQTATYKIIFQVGKFGETVHLDDTIMLPEFSTLVEIRTTISALPHCEWFDEEDRNARRREELALSLERDERLAYPLFRSWVATQSAANQPSQRYYDPID